MIKTSRSREDTADLWRFLAIWHHSRMFTYCIASLSYWWHIMVVASTWHIMITDLAIYETKSSF
jgi:hypothetical protein